MFGSNERFAKLSMDQFMQVKCKFQLTSETGSTESIHSNTERIRLCSTVDLDKNSSLIVMICSNDSGNNHIIAYYIERKCQLNINSDTKLTQPNASLVSESNCTRTKPRIIVKQIYYHHYNEDIVAISISETGEKLAMISASSTIYILPIKNILLNPHAKQLRKSIYFYDASIIDCCTVDDPIALLCWEDLDGGPQIIVANRRGDIGAISINENRQVSLNHINEKINSLGFIRDKFSYSILINCENFEQLRLPLKFVKNEDDKDSNDCSGAVIQRVLLPSSSRNKSSNKSLFSAINSRDRPIASIFYHANTDMVSVVDVLGTNKTGVSSIEPRLLRFFQSKQFHYRPQRPSIVCKLNELYPDEVITHVIITERFLAIATNRHRCLINSRNCSSLRTTYTDPLIKEIKFANDEKILQLIKSPVSNDQDGIIDSFLLVTDRSIYSIEARQSCRDMFVNLIDSHLGIKSHRRQSSSFYFSEYNLVDDNRPSQKGSEVDNFLRHCDDVYEKIIFDGRAFSVLLKLDLKSLHEAYGDNLLVRKQFSLANRFFQMAEFNQAKILGKYIRLGAYNQAIEYIINILNDDTLSLDEKERMDLSKVAFDCLLAKTIIERTKLLLFCEKLKRRRLKTLIEYCENNNTSSSAKNTSSSSYEHSYNGSAKRTLDPFAICDHSPIGQLAKSSTNTIVDVDDEETLTANQGRRLELDTRLECERSLISFINNQLPDALYPYALTQLVDFGLLDIANAVARGDVRIHSLIKILFKTKHENRLIFRDDKHANLLDILVNKSYGHLVKIDSSGYKFLEFITGPVVSKALVNDISLWHNYINFYLNYVGSLDSLKQDIINLINNSLTDCRLAITLFKAIDMHARTGHQASSSKLSSIFNADRDLEVSKATFKHIYNLDGLFDNLFLMQLLERTLDWVPQCTDLNALSDSLGVDGFVSNIALPVENVWRQILNNIHSAATKIINDSVS